MTPPHRSSLRHCIAEIAENQQNDVSGKNDMSHQLFVDKHLFTILFTRDNDDKTVKKWCGEEFKNQLFVDKKLFTWDNDDIYYFTLGL